LLCPYPLIIVIRRLEPLVRHDSDWRELNQEIRVAKTSDHDGRACGRPTVGEVFVSNCLNDWQLRPVRELGRERDDILEHAADSGQDSLDIPKALMRLSPHVAKADDLLVFVPGHLAGEMDDAPGMLNDAHAESAPSRRPSAARIEFIGHTALLLFEAAARHVPGEMQSTSMVFSEQSRIFRIFCGFTLDSRCGSSYYVLVAGS
jgi:hypothetical protein